MLMQASKLIRVPYFQDWVQQYRPEWPSAEWLIIGKGPSFSKRACQLPADKLRMGLNHVVDHVRLDVLHIIDFDVLEQCRSSIAAHTGLLVMPQFPHFKFRATGAQLCDLIAAEPLLVKAFDDGRLLVYDKLGSPRLGKHAPVPVRAFSAEAAFHLLGQIGARRIHTVGIDGGSQHAEDFSDSDQALVNGRKSFDDQRRGIAQAITKYDLEVARLGSTAPVRVFVGAQAEQDLAVSVLRYSIRANSTVSAEVQGLHRIPTPDLPEIAHPANRPRTPFSFQRFLIPEACGDCGRAIYLDSDMLVFGDISELWCQDMHGKALLAAQGSSSERVPQYSVMLLDNDQLAWRLAHIIRAMNDGLFGYQQLMKEMVVAPSQDAAISPYWNSLESYDPLRTKLLHYTDMQHQPWLATTNPLGHLWVEVLLQAIGAGEISLHDVERAVDQGHVRPSLLWQVKTGIADMAAIPLSERRKDRSFSPPHHRLMVGGSALAVLLGVMVRLKHRMLGGRPYDALVRTLVHAGRKIRFWRYWNKKI